MNLDWKACFRVLVKWVELLKA